jgi:capsular exopolysaccharide synthesis family protein
MTDHKALVPHVADGNQLVTLYRYPDVEREEESQEQLVDLSELRAMIFRQRYWIMGAVVICLLLGLAATMMATRIYRSTASVQVEENMPLLTKGQEALEPLMIRGDSLQRYLQAQVDVLQSRYMATRVVDQLRLHENPSFLQATGLDQAKLPTDALRNAAVGILQKGVLPELALGSQVIFISFQSPDPGISAAVANGYAENLITGNLERKYESSSYARDFLSKELERAKQRLEGSERAALDYARNAQIVDTSAPAAASGEQVGPSMPAGSLPAANLARMNADLAAARTARIQAEQRWRTAASMPVMSLPEVVQNGSIQNLQSERAGLVAGLNKLEQTFTADYPDVIRAKSSIASIDTEIQTRARQILDSVRQQYVTAARQESAIAGRMGGLKSATLQEQDRRVQYDILNREAATNRSLYDSLLQRYREVSTAAGVTNNNISILDKATANGSPVSPKPLRNMFLALIAGLGLGFAIAFLRDRINDAVRSPDEVPAKLGLPLLGTTPVVAADKVASDLALPSSGLAESYHSIRSSIEFATTNGAPRSLLITSSRPGEGKSTTALAMASDFSTVGLKVLLVDADLRRPSLHKAVGISNENGFVHVLIGRLPIEGAVRNIEGVDFLPSGAIPPNPTELLAPNNIRSFLKTASSKYDLVIFDGPPVMGLADSPQMSSVVESTVLVLESAAPRSQARTVIRRLRAARANLIGIVLTKFSSKHAGYGHDYGYYYEYSEDRKEQRRLKNLEAV